MLKPREQAPRLAVGFRCHSCSIHAKLSKNDSGQKPARPASEPRNPGRSNQLQPADPHDWVGIPDCRDSRAAVKGGFGIFQNPTDRPIIGLWTTSS